MMGGYTKGPWEYRVLRNGWGFFPVGAGAADAVCGEESDYDPLWSQDPTPADARLIAAAPELYEALSELVEVCAPNIYPQPDKPDSAWAKLQRARATLAKAGGA